MKFAAAMLVAGIQAADKCTWTENAYTDSGCATAHATPKTTYTDQAVDTCKALTGASFKVTKCIAKEVSISQYSDTACKTAAASQATIVLKETTCVQTAGARYVKVTAATVKSAYLAKAGMATLALTVYSYMS